MRDKRDALRKKVIAPPPRQAESGEAAAEHREKGDPDGDLPGSETGIREWRCGVVAL